MIAKIYSRLGPLYIKISEEKVNEIDEVIKKWKYVYVEIYDDDGTLVISDEIE